MLELIDDLVIGLDFSSVMILIEFTLDIFRRVWILMWQGWILFVLNIGIFLKLFQILVSLADRLLYQWLDLTELFENSGK